MFFFFRKIILISMNHSLIEIQNQVFALRPALAEIASKYGNSTLKNYIKEQWLIPQGAVDEQFLEVLKLELKAIYGQDLAETAISQLRKKPLVSTIDHHGIWNHPIFVNSALIYSLNFEPNELALTLATESVSLNNSSSWSGSLLYHNEQLNLERRSFFTDSKKTLPVFSVSPITFSDITRFQKITKGSFEQLLEALKIKDLLGAENFSTQACLLSLNFWQGLFPGAPKLVYLPLESLILKYLTGVLQNPQNFWSRLILTQQGRGLWREYFAAERTFMFWGIDGKGRRQAINSLPEKPEAIFKLMGEKKIYPSSPLCFIVLLKVGLACAGGFTQTTWLSSVKEKFVSLFSRMPNVAATEILALSSVPTKNFAESSLAWLPIKNKYLAPTAVDLYLADKDYYSKYLKLAESLTLDQSLKLAMPVIYHVVIPKGKKRVGPPPEAMQTAIFENLGIEKLLKDVGI